MLPLLALLPLAMAAPPAGPALPAFSDPAGTPWQLVNYDDQSDEPQGVGLVPVVDRESLLRNPACGWLLYDDAAGEVADAKSYWAAQDAAAHRYASAFYLRWRWSDLEPTEGHYAWQDNANFKALVGGALERGLRLAFRVYVDATDNLRPGTPLWVRDAGAAGNLTHGAGGQQLWNPYLDDPVFQAKFTAFVTAFAREFDDPARVDFVDALGLGWWGEGHHLNLKDPANRAAVQRWILGLYGGQFQRVLLGWQYGTEFGAAADEQLALAGEDMVIRRDGFGSQWLGDGERAAFKRLFPQRPIFAEKCYWGGGDGWKTDHRYGQTWTNWHDVHRTTLDEALEFHANTLDLRTVWDTRTWLETPELVSRFVREGGYRLAPVRLGLSGDWRPGGTVALHHAWVNLGVGVLPNRNRRWAARYRPAFALLPLTTNEPVASWTATDAEPGEWLRGTLHSYRLAANLPLNLPPARYRLAAAIRNTRGDGLPALQLALRGEHSGPWHILGEVDVRP